MMARLFTPTWLAAAGLRELFDHFPLALAIVASSGDARLVNRRFEELLDPQSLDEGPLLRVLRSPDQAWHHMQLTNRSGAVMEARAQAMQLSEAVMLLVEETTDLPGSVQFAAMRARLAELERLSAIDRLTGAWNRAHFDRVIESELARSLRVQQSVTLLLFDVDHFKDVNDTYGHSVGDIVLCELVEVLRANTRGADLVFRWGGEELSVLAAATGYRAAALLAEKLRSAVSNHVFTQAGRVTVSVGVAEHIATESASMWFERVDAAMYEAKSGGRNRVVVDRRGSSDDWKAHLGRSLMKLTWLEGYECGNPTIDGEHRALFELANALLDASAKPNAKEEQDQAFAALMGQTAKHFVDEEAILTERNYAHLATHARAHAALLERAADLRRSAREGRATFGDVVDFLANELVARHLLVADREFFPLFEGDALT